MDGRGKDITGRDKALRGGSAVLLDSSLALVIPNSLKMVILGG